MTQQPAHAAGPAVLSTLPVIQNQALESRITGLCDDLLPRRKPTFDLTGDGTIDAPSIKLPPLWANYGYTDPASYLAGLNDDIRQQRAFLTALRLLVPHRATTTDDQVVRLIAEDQARVVTALRSMTKTIDRFQGDDTIEVGVRPAGTAVPFDRLRDAQVTRDTHFLLAGLANCARPELVGLAGPELEPGEASGATALNRITAACKNVGVTLLDLQEYGLVPSTEYTRRVRLTSGEVSKPFSGPEPVPYTSPLGVELRPDDIGVIHNSHTMVSEQPICLDSELAPGPVEIAAGQITLPRLPAPVVRPKDDAGTETDGRTVQVLGWRLPSPSSLLDPRNAGIVAVASLVGMLLIGFPAELVNKTIEENRARFRQPNSSAPQRNRGLVTPVLGFIAFTAVSSFAAVMGRAPGTGAWATASIAFIAVGLTGAAYLYPAEAFSRLLSEGSQGRPALVPAGAVLCVICLVASATLGWNPVYLYGLVLTFDVAGERQMTMRQRGIVLLTGALSLFALSLIALSSVYSRASGTEHGWAQMLMACVYVIGLQSLVFALIPLRFLDGHTISRWSWKAWTAIYLPITFLFVHLLLEQWRTQPHYAAGQVARALTLFVGFGIASVLFWTYFALTRRSRRAEPSPEEDPEPLETDEIALPPATSVDPAPAGQSRTPDQ